MQRIQEEVSVIRTMRETAMASLAEEIEQVRALKLAQPQVSSSSSQVRFVNEVLPELCFTSIYYSTLPQTPVPTSLKRKRDDTGENEDVVDGDAVMDASSVDTDPSPHQALSLLFNDLPSPRKRARRVATVVAQTATAVTIGAIVTWSALAFS